MGRESQLTPEEIAYFHDQKNEPETFGQWSEEKGREREKESNEIKILKETLKNIENAELEDYVANDEEQIKLLEKRKKEAKDMIYNLIERIQEYIKMVNVNLAAQRTTEKDKAFVARLEETDKKRTRLHNALIDSLRITIRNISHNFANIDDKSLEKWEEHLEKHNQDLLLVKRQEFPEKIVCPENIDLNDRHAIAQWASKLQHDLV